jgi:hypothetical protein
MCSALKWMVGIINVMCKKYYIITKMSTETAKIDMEETYGTNNVLSNGHTFQTGAAATMFIQDIFLNQNRQCKVRSCTGWIKNVSVHKNKYKNHLIYRCFKYDCYIISLFTPRYLHLQKRTCIKHWRVQTQKPLEWQVPFTALADTACFDRRASEKLLLQKSSRWRAISGLFFVSQLAQPFNPVPGSTTSSNNVRITSYVHQTGAGS